MLPRKSGFESLLPSSITERQANGRWQPSRKRPSSNALRVRLPLFPLMRLRDYCFGDRLTVGFLALNQETKVRTLLPELNFFGNRLTASRLALTQKTKVRILLPGLGPDTPTGRAARLKPESVWVRLPLWALRKAPRKRWTMKGTWVKRKQEPLAVIGAFS